ncbi:MAG: chromosomal replication initiator protein DnaA [Candidatus Shapirobacteria bacterium]|nr:chromosomal replication initiator protein DnaA [Candidatus Shapirobacteria bacterium]
MDLDRLWKNVTEELKIVLASAVFQTFVSKTQLLVLKDNQAIIGCPSPYVAEQNRKYLAYFKSALDNQTKANNNLEFILQAPIKPESAQPIGPLFSPTYNSSSPDLSLARSGLHPRYTFDNLVVGNSNNFAYAAAQGIVKNPGASYNPFFIWGGVGVGKTHLMQAIGHELIKNNPQAKVRYFPAETFGNELISSLKSKSINQFKDRYRQNDCILVDDIQFIAGKDYTQEEFFHTFNALHMAGKQVILTSDRKPSDIKGLEDRLVSRFMGGLTVDIQPPDFEMRSAIIIQKAQQKGISLNSDAVSYLAENIDSNTREIEGKMQQLTISALSQNQSNIDLNFARNFFHQPNPSLEFYTPVNPRHLISVCAKYFDIKTGDLIGNVRKKDLVLARHLTAYLLLTEINLPLKEVGHLLGGRDHTSIMHARDKITADLTSNSVLRQQLKDIHSLL